MFCANKAFISEECKKTSIEFKEGKRSFENVITDTKLVSVSSNLLVVLLALIDRLSFWSFIAL